jgi:hypothetical protein
MIVAKTSNGARAPWMPFFKRNKSKSTFVSYKRNKNENSRGRYW